MKTEATVTEYTGYIFTTILKNIYFCINYFFLIMFGKVKGKNKSIKKKFIFQSVKKTFAWFFKYRILHTKYTLLLLLLLYSFCYIFLKYIYFLSSIQYLFCDHFKLLISNIQLKKGMQTNIENTHFKKGNKKNIIFLFMASKKELSVF